MKQLCPLLVIVSYDSKPDIFQEHLSYFVSHLLLHFHHIDTSMRKKKQAAGRKQSDRKTVSQSDSRADSTSVIQCTSALKPQQFPQAQRGNT